MAADHGQRRIAVLGSTGSIGTSTLDVIQQRSDRLNAVGLSAHRSWEQLFDQANEHHPTRIVLTDESLNDIDRQSLPTNCELLFGRDGITKLVTDSEVDIVVSAIVGAAGLEGTWAALEVGKTVAVANKETLVMAGPLVQDLVKRRGGTLLPVDSEHSAIFQAIQGVEMNQVSRVVLTGSGGPFRGKKRHELESVTVEEALNHPTWQMGPKITVDSATMMNKALEVIEARWLFDLPVEQIDVIVHPQSMVHSFVEMVDGSVLAQISPPDMRLPIQYALTYPERIEGPAKKLDWQQLTGWDFEQPDLETFPALQLGFEVARRGGTCGAVLNAANEAAVEKFLEQEIRFLDIVTACRAVLDQHEFSDSPSLTELAKLDRWARQEVARWTTLQKKTTTSKS